MEFFTLQSSVKVAGQSLNGIRRLLMSMPRHGFGMPRHDLSCLGMVLEWRGMTLSHTKIREQHAAA